MMFVPAFPLRGLVDPCSGQRGSFVLEERSKEEKQRDDHKIGIGSPLIKPYASKSG